MSCAMPPTIMIERITRPPQVRWKMSRMVSRRRQQWLKSASKPNASAKSPSHSRWEWMRESSSRMVRRYSTRRGISRPSSFSVALT